MSVIKERRMHVFGWKMEDGRKRQFAGIHHVVTDDSIAFEEARIGEEVDDWQPHITGVLVEERKVTPWRETYRTPEAVPTYEVHCDFPDGSRSSYEGQSFEDVVKIVGTTEALGITAIAIDVEP